MQARFDALRESFREGLRWWSGQGLPTRVGALAAAGVLIGIVAGAVLLLTAPGGGDSEPAPVVVLSTATRTAAATPARTPSPPTPAPTETPTPTPTAEPTAEPPATVKTLQELAEKHGDPPDSTLGRFRIPSLGVDAPLGTRFVGGNGVIAVADRSRRCRLVRPVGVDRPRGHARRRQQRRLLGTRGLRGLRGVCGRAVPRPRRLLPPRPALAGRRDRGGRETARRSPTPSSGGVRSPRPTPTGRRSTAPASSATASRSSPAAATSISPPASTPTAWSCARFARRPHSRARYRTLSCTTSSGPTSEGESSVTSYSPIGPA